MNRKEMKIPLTLAVTIAPLILSALTVAMLFFHIKMNAQHIEYFWFIVLFLSLVVAFNMAIAIHITQSLQKFIKHLNIVTMGKHNSYRYEKHSIINEIEILSNEFRTVENAIVTFYSEIEKTNKMLQMRYSTIIESSFDAIIGIDSTGKITLWNYTSERIFGYKKGEIIGTNINKLIKKDEKISCKLNELFNHEYDSTSKCLVMLKELEIFGISKTNQIIICEVTVCRVSFHEAVVFCRDIRERKAMEIRQRNYTNTLEREVMIRTMELEDSKKQLEYALDLVSRGSKNLTQSIELSQNGR